jgi:hypothetical protein
VISRNELIAWLSQLPGNVAVWVDVEGSALEAKGHYIEVGGPAEDAAAGEVGFCIACDPP